MPIIKKEQKNGIMVYHVNKKYKDDAEFETKYANTYIQRNMIDFIIQEDADVFTEDGTLLIRFRKGVMTQEKYKAFYDNVIEFATKTTNNRGTASGNKNVISNETNKDIMTNILGYFDKMSPMQNYLLKKRGVNVPFPVRETRFVVDYPTEYKKCLPMIREIDAFYKKYVPGHYKLQKRKANATSFHISDTSFTTVTTNVNFQTTLHRDTGDDDDGFGNLVVIEDGKYTGGETCLLQYGLGVDVRTGDICFMNVHEWHGNLPMEFEENAKRLSVVCYLRKKIWEHTRGKTRKFMKKHNETIRKLRKRPVLN